MSMLAPGGFTWSQHSNKQSFGSPAQADASANSQRWGQGNSAYAMPQQQPTKPPDLSSYAPGRAQATQTPSFGSAYGQQDWSRPGPVSQSFGAPQEPTYSLQRQQSDMGNYGNTPDARPQGFTSQYFDYSGNPVSFEQQQAQRAALLQQVRQAELPFVFGNALNQDMGPRTLDAQTLLGNANRMVDDGFYNPFLRRLQQDPIQQIGQQASPSLYEPPRPAAPQPTYTPYRDEPIAPAAPAIPEQARAIPPEPRSLPLRMEPSSAMDVAATPRPAVRYAWRPGSTPARRPRRREG